MKYLDMPHVILKLLTQSIKYCASNSLRDSTCNSPCSTWCHSGDRGTNTRGRGGIRGYHGCQRVVHMVVLGGSAATFVHLKNAPNRTEHRCSLVKIKNHRTAQWTGPYGCSAVNRDFQILFSTPKRSVGGAYLSERAPIQVYRKEYRLSCNRNGGYYHGKIFKSKVIPFPWPDAEDNEDNWTWYSIPSSLEVLYLDLHCLARAASHQGED